MSSFLLSGLLLTGCGTQDATGQWVDVAPVTTAAPAQQPAADNNNSNDNGGSDNGSVDNCIFRKNCASVPEERSAIPLQTEQSSAGLLVAIIYSTIPARKFKTICLGCHSA